MPRFTIASAINTDCFPLTSPQREIWFDQMLHGNVHNLCGYMRLEGTLDIERFRQAVNLLAQKHDALRIVFLKEPGDDGLPRQTLLESLHVDVQVHDLSMEDDPDSVALEWMRLRSQQPIDTCVAPLFHYVVLKVRHDCFYSLFICHHLIADGWSAALMARSVAEIYTALEEQQTVDLYAPSYLDFVAEDHVYATSSGFEKQQQYWLQKFAVLPEPLLIARRPEHAGARNECRQLQLERGWYDRLNAFSAEHGVTVFHAILGALYVYFARTAQRDELVVGLPVLNRSNAIFKSTAGMFFGITPARFSFGAELSCGELLQAIGRELKQNYRYQRFPLSDLSRELRKLAKQPGAMLHRLFDIAVSYERHDYACTFGSVSGKAIPLVNAQQQTPLELLVREFHASEAVQLDFVFHPAYFTPEDIELLQQRFIHILEFIQQRPDAPVNLVPLLTETEARQLAVWNQTACSYPQSHDTVPDLFERQAALTPDRVAVVFENEALSYAQLNACANRLAYRLREFGVAPDSLVGICAERSLNLVIGLLGILKAGGAYVPLDPTYPQDRLAYMLEDADPCVVLKQQHVSAQLVNIGSSVTQLDLDAICAATLVGGNELDPIRLTHSAHLAYVIYTSGSTGRPKGVGIDHAGIVNRLLWMQAEYGLIVEDRVLQKTPFSFDVSVWEFFWPLIAGATLVVAKPDGHRDPDYLVELIEQQSITTLHFVPPMLDAFLHATEVQAPFLGKCRLRQVICSGEALPWELQQRFFAQLPHVKLHNLYGPTEVSIDVTAWPCQADSKMGIVPIGKPIANMQTYILDAHLQPMPTGVAGELYLGGIGLARGYLGKPDLTAERFIQNPFSDLPGARMYKTGDLARHLPDGNIEYLGRIDHQVKIRGVRIELGEIESVLAQLPQIREAVVLARGDAPGDKRLVAYLTMRDDTAEVDAEALRAALLQSLPDYMVPAHFILLGQLPLTLNGKIDRKALPAPDRLDVELNDAAPRSATEQALAAIWRQVLQIDRVALDDHFFALGGHSLLAMQIVSHIRKQFGLDLSLRSLFDAPTLHQQALRVDQAKDEDSINRGPALLPVERVGLLPLSFAQQRLWFLDQFEPGSTLYNIPIAVRLTGTLDMAAFTRSLDEIVRRHEPLRTTFTMMEDNPVQVIAPSTALPLDVVDLRDMLPTEREARMLWLVQHEAQVPFDLSTGPLIRAGLIRLDDADQVVLLTIHHIVADGWSMGVLVQEMAMLYAAFANNQASPLPALAIQYADFAHWQRQWLRRALLDKQLTYWKAQLADAPALLTLPIDRPRPAMPSYRGAMVRFTISQDTTAGLIALGQRYDATLFMTLAAAFTVLLSRYAGQDDICIGTPIANRSRAELESLIGFFVNTLVLRTKIDGHEFFSDLLQRVRQTALAAFAHQDVPFEQLVEVLQPERQSSHAPLFQVMLVLQNVPMEALVLPGLTMQPVTVDSTTAKFDLTLDMEERNGQLHGKFEYSADLFDAATIERMAGHFNHVLETIVQQPMQTVATLPLLNNVERHLLLTEFNRSEHDFPLHSTYATLFSEQVARTPESIAAVCEDQRFTYRELDERSARIAHALIAAGAQPNTLVGVMGERNLCFLTMMIAVFKAGAAYVPLDIAHPAQRLRDILQRGRISLILASESSLPLLDQVVSGVDHHPHALVAERLWTQGAVPVLSPMGSPDDLAYVIFTSGSTGHPKGAMVEQKGMLNNLFGKVPALGLGASDRVAQTASPAFDISVWQFLAAPLLGGTVHIMPNAVAHDPQRLLAALATQQVTVLQVVPSMMRLLVAADIATEHASLSLRWVLSIGEALPPGLAQAWFKRFPDIPLINIYGPAECADNVAFYPLCSSAEVQDLLTLASVPIGRPTANMQLFILDAHRQLVPQGVAGEICIAGVGVGRGYLNDPETTAKAFVDNPFLPGERFYLTGDIGRYRTDGNIDYLGRRDHQIKIRGQRIELGEIEVQLQRLADVRDAAVIARQDPRGDMQVVAFWVAQAENGAHADTLRRELSAILPQAMVPAHFMLLDRLPVNANGKVDRKALAAYTWAENNSAIEAPLTDTEQQLATIWSSLLDCEHIGRDSHFFHLGGHSLLATQAVSKIRRVSGIDLPLRTIFEAPILRDLAARIEEGATRCRVSEPALLPVGRDGGLPLSFAQQRLWFLDQLETNSAFYNMTGGLRIAGALNVVALEAALNDIVARHEVLRTAFDLVDGEATQVILDQATVHLSLTELSSRPVAEQEQAAREFASTEAAQPFDLRQAPLLRVRLLRLNSDEHWLLATLHHIAADGWSMAILLRELSALYRARVTGIPASLPALPVQYADFAVWQRRWLESGVLEHQLGYWRTQLAGAPALLNLPIDHPRPPQQSYCGARVSFALSAELTIRLHSLSKKRNVTLFMTLIGAFGVLLSRYSGQQDICIGTPIANRQRTELDNLIGFFVNTLVMRIQFDGQFPFERILQQVRTTALEAYAHQDIPFEQLVEALQPERAMSHAPLFQTMFALQNNAPSVTALDGLELQPLEIDLPVAKFDLTLNMEERGDCLYGAFEYNTDLFEHATIERMAGHFETLLAALDAAPAVPVGMLPLLTAQESALLHGWSRTQIKLPDAPTIHTLFEMQVTVTPDEFAVVCDGIAISYRELNERANRLAHYLSSQGVGPDVLVGLCVERSLDMIIGMLGVIKAGGAYLPLDPALPHERMAYLIEDALPWLVLTQAHLLERLPVMAIGTFCLDRDRAILTAWPHHNPPQCTMPEHLAYVIYTSGSTGKPKGTLIHHRGLVNLALAQISAFQLRPEQRVLQWASFNFDASVMDIFATLCAGARLYIASRDAVLPGNDLSDTLRRYRIELILLTPSALAAMPHDSFPHLQTLVLGGEQCDHALIAPWLRAHTVINAYGPTEATACATIYRCSSDGRRHPPIGRPIANTQTYVLDAYLNLVPIGVVGELYIAGEGLARGYLNRPDLTAERFLQNPFSDQAGARMYRTGDAVRYLPDGQIEYVGRLDHQVKLRGYRIELGEIEFALNQLPEIREAAVLVQTVPSGDRMLVAYVAAASDPLDLDQLRTALQRSLPKYMIPAHFVMLDKLPINTNGKLDRAALPMLDMTFPEDVYVAPSTYIEEILAGIWTELLGLERVGINQNFFVLGGHSLLATRVLARLRAVFAVELPLRALFEAPTIHALAQRIEATQQKTGRLTVPSISPATRNLPLPLSFSQQRLWFLDQLEPGSAFYNMPGSLRIVGRLNVDALECALNAIVERHEVLRTSFDQINGEVRQAIAENAPVPFALTDISSLVGEEREHMARSLAAAEAAQAFDLRTAPLLRVRLLCLDEQEHWLLLVMHHIAADGWSIGILLRELSALYQAYATGKEADLPELPVQYADFAIWQHNSLQGAQWEKHLGYWRYRLAGAPPLLDLPTDNRRPAVQSHRGARYRFIVPSELTGRLHAQSRALDATLFMTLITAFGILLSRYSNQQDICIGTPVANRSQVAMEGLIGCFINTLVLRLQLDRRASFSRILQQMRETALAAFAHQDIPFEQLVEALQPRRSMSHAPLFQAMFSLQNNTAESCVLEGLELQILDIDLPIAKFDLTLDMEEQGDQLHGSFEYSTDLFDATTIERMTQHFMQVLEAVVNDPSGSIGELSTFILNPSETDDNIEHVDRIDDRIKVRGYHIDLREIECALTRLPIVREAVVSVQTVPPGTQELVAYVVPVSNLLDPGKLQEELQRSVPDYMVPTHFVMLDKLPINANGSVDRAVLDILPRIGEQRLYEESRTATEQALATIFAAVFQSAPVSRTGHFFDMGGHSLLMVQLVARIKEIFGVALPLAQVFQTPTVESLARAIDEKNIAGRLIVSLQSGAASSNRQPPIYFIHPAGGTIFGYERLARELGPVVAAHAVQSPEIASVDIGPYDFASLCRRYAEEIRVHCGAGPIRLAGWSLGGALAVGVAAVLEQGGVNIVSVVLFDAFLWSGETESIDFATFAGWAATRIKADMLKGDNDMAASHRILQNFAQDHGTERLIERLRESADRLMADWHLSPAYLDFLQQQHALQARHARLLEGAVPPAIQAPLQVVWAQDSIDAGLPIVDWLQFTGNRADSNCRTVPGNHEDLIQREQNARSIAEMLITQSLDNGPVLPDSVAMIAA
ncbi:MAG TPA: amino acid adenylation domain-containing protein [Burkholderiaceae bacterium]